MYGPLMSVGSSWINQMDSGMSRKSMLSSQQQHPGKADAAEIPRTLRKNTSGLLWVLALLVSSAFHLWLIKYENLISVSLAISELSSSQSISIQISTVQLKTDKPDKAPPEIGVNKEEPSVDLVQVESRAVAVKKIEEVQKIKKVKKEVKPLLEVAPVIKTTTVETVNKIKPISSLDIKKAAPLILPSLAHKQDIKLADVEMPAEQQSSYESLPLIINPRFLTPPTRPKYPRLAKRKKQQGISIIRAKISNLGTVDEIRLHQSSGYRLLDKSAMSALQKWRFEPATKAGKTITAWVQVPVKFKLEN